MPAASTEMGATAEMTKAEIEETPNRPFSRLVEDSEPPLAVPRSAESIVIPFSIRLLSAIERNAIPKFIFCMTYF